MSQRRPREILAEAKAIIEQNEVETFLTESYTSFRITLEAKCIRLLEEFRRSAEERFFEGACRLTVPLFTWFATEAARRANSTKKTNDVITSTYDALYRGILNPHGYVPSEGFIQTCFALIEVIIEADADGCIEFKSDQLYPSPVEVLQRKADLSRTTLATEVLIDCLNFDTIDLQPLEKEVLTLYYNKKRQLKDIAKEFNLALETTKRLFLSSRIKVLNKLSEKEPNLLWKNESEVDYHD